MPYYTTGTVGPRATPLDLLPASAEAGRAAALDEALAGNPTAVGYDYVKLKYLNANPRLTREEAQQRVAEAGVKLDIPESSYTPEALDMLIERKRDEMRRQDILARAPGGFVQGGLRFGVGLAASIIDPLNVASAFIPVVGPARYAGMLERAGAGALARAGVRARVGAIEGFAGAAALEPLVYFGRTQMQDDYDMSDSLLNLAFGTVLGGGLHVAAGRVSDWARGIGREVTVRDIGVNDLAPGAPPAQPADIRIAPAGPRSLATPDPTAPFPRLADITPDTARALALDDLAPDLRAELLAEAGNRAAPLDVPQLRAEVAALRNDLGRLAQEPAFRDEARRLQQEEGLSRKQAEAQARRNLAEQRQELEARIQRAEGAIDQNRRASMAEQDLAAINNGQVPARFAERVEMRAREIERDAAIQRAFPARQIASLASPQVREDTLRTALAQANAGRVLDLEPVLRGGSRDELLAVAQRTASPESVATADFAAADLAAQRLRDRPPTADMQAATRDLEEATAQYAAARQNLEQSGFSAERLQAMDNELKAFDEGIADAKSLADATRAAALCGLRQ